MKKAILELLGLAGREKGAVLSKAVGEIVTALDSLEEGRARFLAAFAYLLGRVANADLSISAEETRKMEELLAEVGDLPAEQAKLVVELAKEQNRLFGGTQNFQVAREFRELSSREDRRRMLHYLFAVSTADETISGDEERQLSQIAEEMGFSHREYIEVRSRYNEQRSVVQRMHRGT